MSVWRGAMAISRASVSLPGRFGWRGASNVPARPAIEWYSRQQKYQFLKQKTVSLVGAPLAAGQHQLGVERGPQMLREGGLEAVARQLGWDFHDAGDVDVEAAMDHFKGQTVETRVKNCERIALGNKAIHEAVRGEAEKGNFVLTVGGDHSIASATISAMRRVHQDLCVIWVDAHADCNTPTTSPSGNYHGMPGAHLLKWVQPQLPGWDWLKEDYMLQEQRLAIIGLRDVDDMERQLLRNSGVSASTMHEVDRWGIGDVVDKAIHRVNPFSDRPVHLSFDIDSCDPTIAPGTGTCSRGGLSFREAHYICERLAMTNNLVSMDLVEVNPNLDLPVPSAMHGDDPLVQADLQTVRLGVELIGSALGKTIF